VSKEPTIGDIVDAMWRVREKRRSIAATEKELSSKQHRLELMLIQKLDEQKTTKGQGKLGGASIKTAVEPTATDWPSIWRWIKRHDDFGLLQKRLSPARYRELLEKYPKGVPGIAPFEKRSIHLTTVKE